MRGFDKMEQCRRLCIVVVVYPKIELQVRSAEQYCFLHVNKVQDKLSEASASSSLLAECPMSISSIPIFTKTVVFYQQIKYYFTYNLVISDNIKN